ncbi:FkbM family methyltransferase [Aurantimonas sp. 22II-16-19i]|uniref:FkbM family methyltransferase n=1 Tax=Aurantimonas sp. 22II-16-19i TaxID=1317114 RepID=UPI0009F7D3BD|nr:FkbM family methyltransferase [Aurantimonas sp. 22II-16-19i]ORE94935.1 Putative methyltransferase [Aurantimonas sp. 22II-16-19i]
MIDADRNYHIPKLTLHEVYPLTPFLIGKDASTPPLNVIDVGANTGLWAAAFFNVFGEWIARYEAFEPMPANVARFSSRPHYAGKANLHAVCVGAEQGEAEINFHAEMTTTASVVMKRMKYRATVVNNDRSRKVPQVSLDDMIDKWGWNRVDLIKIDVEGYEWSVLQGLGKALGAGKVDNILFEFGIYQTVQGQTLKQFYELLSGHGFKIYKQMISKNYYGLNLISHYSPALEVTEDQPEMFMLLATRKEPSPAYVGPRVVGRVN